MVFIALSVLCSVTVSVVLKLAPRYGVDMRQAITGNYAVAALLAMWLLHPDPNLLLRPVASPAWRVMLALGVLLPSIFVVEAESVRRVGVVRTDVADRLSLLLPLAAAFTVFGQAFHWQVGVGMVAGVIAIVCIVMRRSTRATGGLAKSSWGWPVGVFFGGGIIDILFKRVAQLTQVPFADVLLATFVLAFGLAMLVMAWLFVTRRASWRWRHLVGAVLLGVFNFGDIAAYVEAQRRLPHNPALVFSLEDIGVIVLAALVGVFWFGEYLERRNRVGIALAIAAVAVLATA